VFFTDAASDRYGAPTTLRAELERRISNTRMRMWSDPSDREELREMLKQLEQELRALDRSESGGAA
jgi:hypothetical protein